VTRFPFLATITFGGGTYEIQVIGLHGGHRFVRWIERAPR
jgi:hypothetical protein